MAGNREKDWGKDKKFREGQAKQVLDTLFFDFIDLAKELQPKVVVAENVSGLMMGSAKDYVKKIYIEFQKAGYQLRIEPYLLDASKMGVPQRRRRVFFVALRNDLAPKFIEQVDLFQQAPKLDLIFNEKNIMYKEIKCERHDKKVTSKYRVMCVSQCTDTGAPQTYKKSIGMKLGSVGFGSVLLDNCIPNTVTTGYVINKDKMCYATKNELCKIGSYPLDYNFLDNKFTYLIAMSVPPVMMAQIATEIHKQWLKKII